MSLISFFRNLVFEIVLLSYIISSMNLPTSNDCSIYKGTSTQIENKNYCLYTSMSNYESCCFIAFTNSSGTTNKFCITLKENITDLSNYDKTTIINSFSDKENITEIECPGLVMKENNNYINNCGLVGVLPPLEKNNCSGIAIPESHCCMIELENGDKVCRRVKKSPKDENDIIEDVKQDIARMSSNNLSVKKIYCSEHFIHLATSILVICLLNVIL
jgi:hypothetical protein